jgi:hypothetical protein
MYYFTIPNLSKATTAIVPCYQKENKQWAYNRSVDNKQEDAIVSEKAQIFSVPDSLDELTLLQNAMQIGIAGVVAYLINNSDLEMVETVVLTGGPIKVCI